MEELLNFSLADLAPIEYGPFKLGDNDCILRQASHAAAKEYSNALIKAGRMQEDGKVVITGGLADGQAPLIAACLLKVMVRAADGNSTKTYTLSGSFSLQQIQAWPDQVCQKLFDKIVEMSPTLLGKPTRESLEKRLADTQKALDLLGEGNGHSKNSPSAMMENSV
jgi:hypothetical protein